MPEPVALVLDGSTSDGSSLPTIAPARRDDGANCWLPQFVEKEEPALLPLWRLNGNQETTFGERIPRTLDEGPAPSEDAPRHYVKEEGILPAVAFALPVLPGKEELDHQTFEEMEGTRRDEYEAALKEAGITRHVVWHQETPDDTMAIVYMEADDDAGVAQFGSSDAPFNRWFRDQMKEVHGIDISEPAPPPKKVHDVQL